MRRFTEKHTFNERLSTAEKMLESYPDRVPVICEPSNSPNIELKNTFKTKYIIPKGVTMGKFLLTIRQQLDLTPEQAIYIFVNNTLPPTASLVGDIYHRHKAKDKFLYVCFAGENTFGERTFGETHF